MQSTVSSQQPRQICTHFWLFCSPPPAREPCFWLSLTVLITDYYSRCIEIIYMGHDTTAKTTITKFKNVFARWGIPQEVITDNGPQFCSEFKAFADECGFIATTSSPKYPQSDGAAEKSFNIAKHILSQESPMSALMEYRATPTAPTGFSPAMLMMGRNIPRALPATSHYLEPGWPPDKSVHEHDDVHKARNEYYYNEVAWWASPAVLQGLPLATRETEVTLFMDASSLGWGAQLGSHLSQGLWLASQRSWHINVLEMQAAINAVRAFLPHLRSRWCAWCVTMQWQWFTSRTRGGGALDPTLSCSWRYACWSGAIARQ